MSPIQEVYNLARRGGITQNQLKYLELKDLWQEVAVVFDGCGNAQVERSSSGGL